MKNNIVNPYPSDAAVCLEKNGFLLRVAVFAPDGSIRTTVLETGSTLSYTLRAFREEAGFATDPKTIFRFCPSLFTEQTHIASLPDEILAKEGDDFVKALSAAARSGLTGKNGLPVFESDPDLTHYDFVRIPTGEVTLTELPREVMSESLQKLLAARPLDASLGRIGIADETSLVRAVETRLRAAARFLVSSSEDIENSSETVAVFCFTPEGCGFALWNREKTLFAEYGEWFNLNFDESEIPEEMSSVEYVEELYVNSCSSFLNEQFFAFVTNSKISVSRLFWTASDGLEAAVGGLLDDFGNQTSTETTRIENASLEEIIVRGLLLAYDERAEKLVPSINLANDIFLQNQSIFSAEAVKDAEAEAVNWKTALALMILPVLAALGIVYGLWLNAWRAEMQLANRERAALAEQERLRPRLQARADYEKTLKWYEDILRQIIGLQQKRGASLSFAANLDPLFPRDDASFFVSDLKLSPGGAFEIKGLTRSEQAVSAFVGNLEFAQDENKNRRFTNLQVDFRQGSVVSVTNAAATLPQSAPGGISGNLAPGVSGFFIKGNYAAAAVIKAQSPSAAPSAAPVANTAPPSNVPLPNTANANSVTSNTGTK